MAITKGNALTSVGILTVHQSVNCGASLQAAALYKSVEDCGAEPTVIDYCPSYFMSYMDKNNEAKRKTLRGRIKTALIGSRLAKTMNMFGSYAREHYPRTTERFDSLREINESEMKKDIYLCGSDQIWNPPHVHFDKTWLLDFKSAQSAIKASYAASIGKDALSQEDLDWLSEGVLKFDKVSVREEAGVRILASMGIDAVRCLDPTLLRSKEEWMAQIEAPRQKLPEKFIFYYPIEENVHESEMLAVLKHRTGLPCVALTDAFRKPKHADIQVTEFGPRQFLYLISNSEMVFTNSFHGLVFSLLFEKLLISYKNETKNSRLESMFDILNLPGYQIKTAQEIDSLDFDSEHMRFIASYENLKCEIKESWAYLESVIELGQ